MCLQLVHKHALIDAVVDWHHEQLHTAFVNLPEGVKMVMPGDNVTVEVELITTVALEEQMRFAIREGGKTVGAGVVTKIIE